MDVDKRYKEILDTLENCDGKIIAIDPITGDYFLGATTMEAYDEAVKFHPGQEFVFKRVGAKATYIVAAL